MLLYSSQTFCIAADTAANVSFLSAAQLIRPGRICNQLAAHGSIGNAAVGKLLLHKVRIRQPPTPHTGSFVIFRTQSQ